MSTEEELDRLCLQVAARLGGRPVNIVWGWPKGKTNDGQWAAGQTVKRADGSVAIWVMSGGTVPERFEVFLHECAHVQLDYDWIPPEGAKSQPYAEWLEADAREKRAASLAKCWSQFAAKNARKYYGGGRDLVHCKLLALLEISAPQNFLFFPDLKDYQ